MKYYFFGSTQGKIYTLHGFCCAFGLFIIFWGVSRCLLQISIDEVKAGQSCLERLEPGGGFSR